MAEVVVTTQPQGASELGEDERDTQEESTAKGQGSATGKYYMSETSTRGTECVRRVRSGLRGEGRGNAPPYSIKRGSRPYPRQF